MKRQGLGALPKPVKYNDYLFDNDNRKVELGNKAIYLKL